MPDDKKTIELNILGNEFSVKSLEDDSYIESIATFVNTELEKVKEKNPFTNLIRIAILGCMNITELYFRAQDEVKVAEDKYSNEVINTNSIKMELESTKTELSDMNAVRAKTLEEKEKLDRILEEKEELLNQYREHLKQAKVESETNRKSIIELQNQLFECQIELVKVTKNDTEMVDS